MLIRNMKTYFKLAWRNIWRNRRRTIITAASIFAAIFFALIMRAFQLGSYGNMIDNIVQTYTGDIQIHAKGYWEDRSIDKTFSLSTDGKNNSVPSIETLRTFPTACFCQPPSFNFN